MGPLKLGSGLVCSTGLRAKMLGARANNRKQEAGCRAGRGLVRELAPGPRACGLASAYDREEGTGACGAHLCCEPACGCERRGGRKRRLPVHQLPRPVQSKKTECPELVPARSQAQTSPGTAFVLLAGYNWGLKRASFCPCPPYPGV